jgi:hypothetical protein
VALLLNAVIHIAQAIGAHTYNPGLITAMLLLLPGGWNCLHSVQAGGFGAPLMHVIGATVALGVHAAIAAQVLRNRFAGS